MASLKSTEDLSVPLSDSVVPADTLSINTGTTDERLLTDAAFLQFASDREWERWVEQCVNRGVKKEQMRAIVRSIAASLSNEKKKQLEEKMAVQIDRVQTSSSIDHQRKDEPKKRVHDNATTFTQRMKNMLGWEPARKRRANHYTKLGMQSLEVRAVMDASGDVWGPTAQVSSASGIEQADWASTPATVQSGEIAEMHPEANVLSYATTLSPDGSKFATADQDGTIKVFDGATGAELMSLNQGGLVDGVAWSHNGAYIASTGYDKTIKLWDANTGALLSTISLPNLGTQVGFSPDDKTVLAGAAETGVLAYDIQTGTCLAEIPMSSGHFSIAPDGNTIAGINNRTIIIYDMQTHAITRTLSGLPDDIYCMDIDPTGQYVAAGDNSGNTAVWNLQSGDKLTQVRNMTGKPESPGGIWALGYSKTGYLIEGNFNGDVIVNDMTAIDQGIMTPVNTYKVNPVVTSVVSSQNGREVMITTANNAQDSRVDVLQLPFTEPPAPAPDPTPSPDQQTDPAALASDLATTVSQTLDAEANTIGYAKMQVSYEAHGYDSVTFKVEFRNPGEHTSINVTHYYDDGSNSYFRGTTVDTPTADGTWQFDISRGDGNANGTLVFVMRDTDSGKIIDTVTAHYNAYTNAASIDGSQPDFSVDQQGLLAENPITPDIKVVQTSGPNMLVAIQTPYDNAYLTTNMGGYLSSAIANCSGGSTFSLMRITVDANRPTGDYQLQLFGRQGGMALDTLTFHWDQSSKTATINSADMYTGDQSTQEGQQTFDNMLSVTSAYMGDVQINQIEKTRLYWATANLPAPYHFFIDGGEDLMNRILQVHPEYRPENFDASVDAMWDQIGHSYTRGQAQDMFVNGMNDYINTMREDLGVYEEAMSDVMQTAINGIIQILHGGNQQQQFDAVQQCLDRWNNVNHLAIYQSDYMKLGGLSALGISLPSCGAIMEAAKRLYNNEYQQLIQTEQDVITQRDREDFLREKGLRQTAEGDWVAASGASADVVADLTTDQVRLAAKIASYMGTSTHLASLYTPTQRATIAARTSGLLTLNSSADEITNAFTVVMNSNLVQQSNVLDGIGGSPADADTKIAAQNVDSLSTRELYAEALGWLNDPTAANLLGSFPVRTDTIVGRIVAGAFGEFCMAQTNEQKWEIAFKMQRLTDIPADKFMGIFGTSDTLNNYSQKMMALMQDAQYSDILESPASSNTSQFIDARPDIPLSSGKAYDGTQSNIRIRFDLMTAGKDVRRVEAYFDGQRVGLTGDSAFINIPISIFNQSLPSATITLHAVFTDGTTTDIESDPFAIIPNNAYSTVDPSNALLTNETLSNDPIENAILERTFEPVDKVNGTQWHATLGSPFHTLPKDINAVDLNYGSENDDKGQKVFASFGGVVTETPEDGNLYGIVEIKHAVTVMINGQSTDIVWYSRYMHMDNIQVKVGDVVNAHTFIGDVSDVRDITKIDPMYAHLHFAEYIKEIDSNGNEIIHSIDMTKWLNYLGISSQ